MNDALRQDIRDTNMIFVHGEVDDAGLTPNEFRVYGHLARRAGKDGAYPGIDSMARVCQIRKLAVIEAIKVLEQRNMITVLRNPGTRNTYLITRLRDWKGTVIPNDTSVVSENATSAVRENATSVVSDNATSVVWENVSTSHKSIQLSTAVAAGLLRNRIGAIVGRKPDTVWIAKELKAFKTLKFDEDEICMVERYYAANRKKADNFCRRDVFTLVNNWPGEVDRARAWCEKNPLRGSKTIKAPVILPLEEQATEETMAKFASRRNCPNGCKGFYVNPNCPEHREAA